MRYIELGRPRRHYSQLTTQGIGLWVQQQFVWFCGLNAIPPKGFRPVQRAIGACKHPGEVVAVRCRKADTDGGMGIQALCPSGCFGEPPCDRQAATESLGMVTPWQKRSEFLTAQPDNKRVWPRFFAGGFGEQLQNLISGLMSMTVVDRLEVVEVEGEQ